MFWVGVGVVTSLQGGGDLMGCFVYWFGVWVGTCRFVFSFERGIWMFICCFVGFGVGFGLVGFVGGYCVFWNLVFSN